MATKTYVKNLKDYSVVAFSWNPSFQSISFKPQEVKDCSGIELDAIQDNFQLFYTTYIKTNILTMISLKVPDVILPEPITGLGYFDYGYIEDGWSVTV